MNKLKAWVELIAIILSAVASNEAAAARNGLGAVKFAALWALLEEVWDEFAPALGQLDGLRDRIARIVAKIVAAANAAGAFVTGSKTEPKKGG